MSFSTREFLTKGNMTIAPAHPTFLSSPIEGRMKGCHFDTVEVTEAELQAVLNILTEHDFQDALKNSRSAGYCAYSCKGTFLSLLITTMPKVSFYWMEAPVPKILDCSLQDN
jgi:hypothetical protein